MKRRGSRWAKGGGGGERKEKKREEIGREGRKTLKKTRNKKKRRGKDETDKNTESSRPLGAFRSRLDLGTDSAPFLAAPLVSIRLTVIKEEAVSLSTVSPLCLHGARRDPKGCKNLSLLP